MLDLRYLAAHPQEATARLRQRGMADASERLERLLASNAARKEAQAAYDAVAGRHHLLTKQVGEALRQGYYKEAEGLKKHLHDLKEEQQECRKAHRLAQERCEALLLGFPNLPHASVPAGGGPADNVVTETWEPLMSPPSGGRPHWELLEAYGLADFARGAKVTGSGFPFYIGRGARLQRGLIQYFLDLAVQEGYQEVQPPLLVNAATAQGTGQLPDKEGMMYELPQEGLYLLPTAEVPMTNLHAGEVVRVEQLPLRYVAYTPCFRREAGSWGSHVRGLNRLHQFDKVELVALTHPQAGLAGLERMVAYAKGLLQQLGLRYRVLQLCTGDLGTTASITYDLEVWAAGQERWLEVSSVSLCGAYQARRMQLRYKEGGRTAHCHTLNGSALALPRVVAALLEHYQTAQEIALPAVLHSYLPFTAIA